MLGGAAAGVTERQLGRGAGCSRAGGRRCRRRWRRAGHRLQCEALDLAGTPAWGALWSVARTGLRDLSRCHSQARRRVAVPANVAPAHEDETPLPTNVYV